MRYAVAVVWGLAWGVVHPVIGATPAIFQEVQEPEDEGEAPGSRIHRSIPPPGAKTHQVVPGERFRAGSLHRWFYGDNYRDLWTTPIEVEVLDLDGVGGGLTPLRTGGFGQSVSLHFTGEDGRRYTVRSLDKDPTRRLADSIKNTVVGEVLHDLVSTLMPAAALVVDPLMEATGVLHSKHTLVVIPDDPRLGAYREQFAGLIGTLQEHPSEGPDDSPGFAGSRKVSGTDTVWGDLEERGCERVDARAFLKARLVDLLINDKDRHSGQWRWARFPEDDCFLWLPIPEDRDQAFIHYEGFGMMLVRLALPRAIKFGDSFPNLAGLTITGWEMDRDFLVRLDKSAWNEVVEEFRRELPDPVIEDAVRRLPPPYYELFGETLTAALKARRDGLPEFVDRYYELITRQAEVMASDEDEVLVAEHLPSGDLRVRIEPEDSGGDGKPWFERTFRHEETKEVRVYLRGGDDRAEIAGGKGRITVRIDGGGGSDTFENKSGEGSSKTWFYDWRGDNVFVEGRGARIDERPWQRPPGRIVRSRYALDWGRQTSTIPMVEVDPDLGLFAKLTHVRSYLGFRKDPFATRHSFGLGAATRGFRPLVSYEGRFRDVRPDLDIVLDAEYSGFDIVRFKGFGNEVRLEHRSSFYRLQQRHFILSPKLAYRRTRSEPEESGESEGESEALVSEFTASFGPVVKWSNTPEEANQDTYLGSLEEPLYGAGSFGQTGLRGELEYDSRDSSGYATRGVLIQLQGAAYPGLWDVESAFGSVSGEARTYLTADIPTRPTLALRVGGKRVWGKYPFHESAFLGGPGDIGIGESDGPIRGFHKNRFAGDASLYSSAELRLVLSEIRILLPMEVGLFGASDVGRVFWSGDPDDADTWHNGTGGGIWLSFLERRTTLSVGAMKGRDFTGLYVRAGYMF